MQSRHCNGQERIVIIKDADKHFREKQDKHPGSSGINERGQSNKTDCLFHIIVSFGAVIIAQNRRRAVGNGKHRRIQYLPHGVDNCHGGNVNISAEGAQHPVTCNLHQTVGTLHNEAGTSQTHNIQYAPLSKGRLPFQADTKLRPFARKKTHHKNSGQNLRANRRKGGSPDAEMKDKNKNRVQHNIGNRSEKDSGHAHICKALRVDEGIHPKRHHGKHGSHQINAHIGHGIGKGCP